MQKLELCQSKACPAFNFSLAATSFALQTFITVLSLHSLLLQLLSLWFPSPFSCPHSLLTHCSSPTFQALLAANGLSFKSGSTLSSCSWNFFLTVVPANAFLCAPHAFIYSVWLE